MQKEEKIIKRNKIRNSKNKGSSMEYIVHETLKTVYPDMTLTKERGYVKQYDLCSEAASIAIECKFHKGFTWNKAVQYFVKLEEVAHRFMTHYLIFKSNQQPILCMFRNHNNHLVCTKADDKFGIEFKRRKEE